MDWHRLGHGPYSGKTIPEIMFQVPDPDYVLDGLERGEFSGAVRDEATELCRRAARIRLEPDVVVYYQVDEGSYCGLAMVPKASPERDACEKTAAARTEGYLDLTILKRVAPGDELATMRLLRAFEYHWIGESMTLTRFFENPDNFLTSPAGRQAA
jgi:hypothetical protein